MRARLKRRFLDSLVVLTALTACNATIVSDGDPPSGGSGAGTSSAGAPNVGGAGGAGGEVVGGGSVGGGSVGGSGGAPNGGAGTGGGPECTTTDECEANQCAPPICLEGACVLIAYLDGEPCATSSGSSGVCHAGECRHCGCGYVPCEMGQCPATPCIFSDPVDDDCTADYCTEVFQIEPGPDPEDHPASSECGTFTCVDGAVDAVLAPQGAPCHSGDGTCDGNGACDCEPNCECTVDADCAIPEFCTEWSCVGGFCEYSVAPPGYSPYQVQGDCTEHGCGFDGSVWSIGSEDAPPHPDPCMFYDCPSSQSSESPTPVPKNAGAPCPTAHGTGFCGGNGTCYHCYLGQGTCPAGYHCPADPFLTYCVGD